MKKLLTILTVMVLTILTGCSNAKQGADEVIPNPPLSQNSTILVSYFSWSSAGNTATMAQYVADATGGELFRINPKTPYTTNYNDVIDIAQEEKNSNARPELAEAISSDVFENYDVVFLGYPIWWYDAPMIIYTFLESHDFTGKTIVPFATSGGSSINEETKFANVTGATVLDGLCIPNFSASDTNKSRVSDFVENTGLSKEDMKPSEEVTRIKMTIQDEEIVVELADNSATRDLIQRLAVGPMELTFQDFGGSEKIAYPNPPLDLSDTEGYDPEVGDLMIYKPWNNLCAFYVDSSGYSDSLILIGKIQDNGIQLLAAKTGDFVVTISLI